MPAPVPSLPGLRLHSLIGAGPSGRVYRARDEVHAREVAVKLLEPRRCTPAGLVRLAAIAARAATSPMVRDDQLYKVVPHPTHPFVIMDLLPGESLQAMLLRTGPMSWKKARAIGHAIAVALEAAHDVGAVHGAVKPTNVFIHDNFVYLTDFGIRTLPAPLDPDALLADAARMAPEQLRGEPVDLRTDVYGLGLVMFELVTGRLPFVGPAREVLRQQRSHRPPAVTSLVAALPPSADTFLFNLLDKRPDRRPPSASRLRGLLSAPDRLPDEDPSMVDRVSWHLPPEPPSPVRAALAGSPEGTVYLRPAAEVPALAAPAVLAEPAATLAPTLHVPKNIRIITTLALAAALASGLAITCL